MEHDGYMPYHGSMPKRTPEMHAEALAGPRPLTLDHLRAALADASPATAFRYLRQGDYLRSYPERAVRSLDWI